MPNGVIFGALLLCAALGTRYFIQLRDRRRYEAECQKHQEDGRRRLERQAIDIERIREKVKAQDPFAYDPAIVVHHFEVDEHGRSLTDQFLHQLPDAPPVQLHGDGLNTIECPDFFQYKIPGQANAA